MPESSSCSDVKAWIESGVLWRSVSRRVAVTTISSSCAETAKGRAPTTAAAKADRRRFLLDMKPPQKASAKNNEIDHCILRAAPTRILALGKTLESAWRLNNTPAERV